MIAKPYVYRLEHRETGQFYYGVRMANEVPAKDDLFVRYFSSSKTVASLGVENFLHEVVQDFDDRDSALRFEDQMIRETIEDPLSLNLARTSPGDNKFYFYNAGRTFTEEHRKKISQSGKGKHSNNGANRFEVRLKNSQANRGRKIPKDVIERRVATRRMKNGGQYFVAGDSHAN